MGLFLSALFLILGFLLGVVTHIYWLEDKIKTGWFSFKDKLYIIKEEKRK